MKQKLIHLLIYLFYKTLTFTWRIEFSEDEGFKERLNNGTNVVIAHWHGDELGILYCLKRYHASIIASTSKDGALMAGVAKLLGGAVSRGSSTRGGVGALKGILKLAKEGWNPSVAVDGPKGPIYEIKPGVFEISKLLQADIYPLSVEVKSKYIFEKAWNKTFLPLPFTKVQVVVGKPMEKVPRKSDSRDPNLAKELKKRLNDAKSYASKLVAASS